MICVARCPDGCIAVNEEGYPVTDYDNCKGCMICVEECPAKAIERGARCHKRIFRLTATGRVCSILGSFLQQYSSTAENTENAIGYGGILQIPLFSESSAFVAVTCY